MKLVVLNDLHPEEAAGAASIAMRLTEVARQRHQVEFWCSWINIKPNRVDPNTKFMNFDESDAKKRDRFITKVYKEFFDFKSLFWIYTEIRRFRPDVVWVHQVGNRFPKTVILLFKIMRIKVVVTSHDFGGILPRKLFPQDLMPLNQMTLQKNQEPFNLNLRGGILRNLVIKTRMSFLREIYNLADMHFLISNLQERIYVNFGYRIKAVVPNGVDRCVCNSYATRESRSILFAGRDNGKGLTQLLLALREQKGFHLHLAGSDRLLEIIAEANYQGKVTFHGKLSQDNLFELLHQIKFVSALSECFDVYPSMVLEAISHGALPLTSTRAGNSQLVEKMDPNLVIDMEKIINLNFLYDLDEGFNRYAGKHPNLISFEDSFSIYDSFICSLEKH